MDCRLRTHAGKTGTERVSENAHLFLTGLLWLVFVPVFIRACFEGQLADPDRRGSWIQAGLALLIFTLMGERMDLRVDRWFGGLPVTLYLKYFGMLVWFQLYYAFARRIVPDRPIYRYLNVVIPAGVILGLLTVPLVAAIPYGERSTARLLVTGLRDVWILLLSLLAIAPAARHLSVDEGIPGMRIKQGMIFTAHLAYAVVAVGNITVATLIMGGFDRSAEIDRITAPFMGMAVLAFVVLLLPYRWLQPLFLPQRFWLYWRLKLRERQLLRAVAARSDLPWFSFHLLRADELELALYRTVINLYDYGLLLPPDAP